MTHYKAVKLGVPETQTGPREPGVFEPDIIAQNIGLVDVFGKNMVRNVDSAAFIGLSGHIGSNFGAIMAGLAFNDIQGRVRTIQKGAFALLYFEGIAGGAAPLVTLGPVIASLGLEGLASLVSEISPPAKGRVRFNESTGAFLAVVKPGGYADGGGFGLSTLCGAFKADVTTAGAESGIGFDEATTRINDLFEVGSEIGIGFAESSYRLTEAYPSAISSFGLGDLAGAVRDIVRGSSVGLGLGESSINHGANGQTGGNINVTQFIAEAELSGGPLVPRYYVRLDDYYLPGLKWVQMRMEASDDWCWWWPKPSFLSCCLPYTEDVATEIADLSNAEMIFEAAYFQNDVEQLREEIIRVDLASVRIDRGAESKSITLSGYRRIFGTKTAVSLSGVLYASVMNNGRRMFRCVKPDFYLRPGATVSFEGENVDISTINWYISTENGQQRMELTEAVYPWS